MSQDCGPQAYKFTNRGPGIGKVKNYCCAHCSPSQDKQAKSEAPRDLNLKTPTKGNYVVNTTTAT